MSKNDINIWDLQRNLLENKKNTKSKKTSSKKSKQSKQFKEECSTWDLYYSMFKDGDEVIIITEDDDYLWGSVTAINAGAILSRPNKEDKLVPWEDIRFMSHDGFPVKKLMGADGSNLIELLDTTDTQEAIRQALAYKKICKINACNNEAISNSDECHDHLVFGEEQKTN